MNSAGFSRFPQLSNSFTNRIHLLGHHSLPDREKTQRRLPNRIPETSLSEAQKENENTTSAIGRPLDNSAPAQPKCTLVLLGTIRRHLLDPTDKFTGHKSNQRLLKCVPQYSQHDRQGTAMRPHGAPKERPRNPSEHLKTSHDPKGSKTPPMDQKRSPSDPPMLQTTHKPSPSHLAASPMGTEKNKTPQ